MKAKRSNFFFLLKTLTLIITLLMALVALTLLVANTTTYFHLTCPQWQDLGMIRMHGNRHGNVTLHNKGHYCILPLVCKWSYFHMTPCITLIQNQALPQNSLHSQAQVPGPQQMESIGGTTYFYMQQAQQQPAVVSNQY